MAAEQDKFFPVFSQLHEATREQLLLYVRNSLDDPQASIDEFGDVYDGRGHFVINLPESERNAARERNDASFQAELERRCGCFDIVREYEAEQEGEGQ